ALAYVEKEGSDVRLVAAEGDEHDVLKTVGLGSSGAPARGQRGALSLSFDPREANQVNLLGRVGESECVDSGRRECSGFSWWRLVGGRAESQGFSLSVPAPCTEHAVSLLGAPGKLAYSVCSDQAGAERRTTLFTVQTDPQYARADPVLPGCQPLGLFGEGSSVWLIGECEGKRRAARAGADNGPVEVRDVASPRVECVGGKARLRAGPIEVELNAPRARLELVLPTVLAPRGSRAVWSGEALLVAAAPLRKLSLARYACEGNQLKEVSVGAASAAPSAK
ncbi:MAG TPA: hypothetical protein VFQ35_24265, partial [Polyangiaceae bacterium]|nr:hypothetical protein [Polyangiaceae bacterium]